MLCRLEAIVLALVSLIVLAPVTVSFAAPPAGADPRTHKHPKLDSQLLAVDAVARDRGEDAALEDARRRGLTVRDRKVRVVVESTGDDARRGRAAATANGGSVEAEYAGAVQALVPPGALKATAERGEARYVRSPYGHRAAEVVGEGVGTTNAWSALTRGGTGTGVKVGIIDLGFAGRAARQASGDLPASVTTVSSHNSTNLCPTFGFDATDHGTAVAEIVHDVAPRAQLYLICVETEITLALAKDYAKANGIKVINHSVVWYNSSRGDGSGVGVTPDATVRDARNNGILWVNAAGNDGQNHWSGTFTDTNNDGAINFSGSDQTQSVTIHQNELLCFYLKWDRWPVTNQDFDLYMYTINSPTQATVPLTGSASVQNGNDPPVEQFCHLNVNATATFHLLIARIEGTTSNPRFDLFSAGEPLQYKVPGGSILEPGSSPNAMAVGAICWANAVLAGYSARGPTIDGRRKPDVVAPDSVSTATYGPYGSCGSINGFAGTSAASPQIAGLAAAVKTLNPGFTAPQLQSYLELRALDLGTGGKDNNYGAGRVWLRSFVDVSTSNYAFNSIETLFASGLTTGCSYKASTTDRRYCPGSFVTRAEMAPFLVNAMGLGPCTTCTTQTFTDVPKTYWAYQWIEQLVKQGVTAGCSTSPKRYCPGDNVTRAQMAPFLMRASGIGQCNNCTTQTFTDVPKTYWAWRWIEQLVKEGVTAGCSTSPKKYCPEANVVRRDMAIFLVRTFDLTGAPDGTTFVPTGDLHDLVFSPDGTRLYASQPAANRVEVFNISTGKLEAPIAVGAGPKGLDVTADGSTLYVANSGTNTVSVVDLATKGVTNHTIPGCPCTDHPFSVAIRSDEVALVTTTFTGSGFGGRLLSFDPGAGTPFPTPSGAPFGGATTAATWVEPSGDRAIIGLSYGNAAAGPVFTWNGTTFSSEHDVGSLLGAPAVNAAGSQLMVSSTSTTDILNGSLVETGSVAGHGRGLAFGGGTTGYRTRYWGTEILNTGTASIVGALALGDSVTGSFGRTAASPDGSLVAIVTDDGFSLVETS